MVQNWVENERILSASQLATCTEYLNEVVGVVEMVVDRVEAAVVAAEIPHSPQSFIFVKASLIERSTAWRGQCKV